MTIFQLDELRPQFAEDASCWIAPTAVLIGRVVLRKQSSIWFGSILRADDDTIEIGERSNVQDGCVLHVDPGLPIVVGADVTIGHSAIIHGCTIGSNTLIGMGATILNGARIGANCLIGANSLITEGKEIPDNSVVMGSPGRVVREVDDATIESLRRSADVYVRRAVQYRRGLAAIAEPSNG
ncbi:gamma carbonic anhydrase family protein [Pseudochelatococcus sp. B33]